MVDYERNFNQLSRYAPYLVDTKRRRNNILRGGFAVKLPVFWQDWNCQLTEK